MTQDSCKRFRTHRLLIVFGRAARRDVLRAVPVECFDEIGEADCLLVEHLRTGVSLME